MIYEKLGFDKTVNYGDTLNLADSSVRYVQNQNPKLDNWMVKDIVSDTPVQYYKNPLKESLDLIISYLTSLQTYSDQTQYQFNYDIQQNALHENVADALTKTQDFYDHTDCISGVKSVKDLNKPNGTFTQGKQRPELNNALMIGHEMLVLTNSVDNIKDNSPMLGCFSSLYIKDQLDNYVNSINDFLNELEKSITKYTREITLGKDPIIQFNMQTLANYVSLITNRMNSDINFYNNSLNIYQKYQSVRRFKSMGSLHKKLINELIGTDHLKSNIT